MQGGTVLFVGTKRQAQETVRDEAIRCGMPYVTERWLGGMLTNWVTMYQRINELERLERMRDTGEINRLTKKEGLMIQREINRLLIRLSGVRTMRKLPDMLFVVDVIREETSVHEANLLDIPVVALVDTNCDPGGVDYVIPSNDDAIRAIKLLVGKVADAVLEGKAMRKDMIEEETEEAIELPISTTPARGRYEMETEMEDEELLGAATLAKLGTPKREPVPEAAVETPAAAAEVAAEEAEAVLSTETPEASEAEEAAQDTEETEETEEAPEA
jgi:small subunit ribosomal protein S2